MAGERLRIGELLIEAGVLNHAKLREALEIQRSKPNPLGRILLESGMVTEPQLVQALSRQLALPWVSLWHVDVPQDLADLLSREEAEEHRMLPIYVRHMKGTEPSLFVALDDPTNTGALEFMQNRSGMTVKPMVAGPTDLSHAIRTLYGDDDEDEDDAGPPPPPPLGQVRRISSPPPPPPPRRKPPEPPPSRVRHGAGSAPEMDKVTEEIPTPEEALEDALREIGSIPPPPPDEPTDAAPGVSGKTGDDTVPGAAPAPAPAPAFPTATPPATDQARVRPRLRRAFAFTFLDGTTLSLGGQTAADAAAKRDDVSLQGLISGLRRHADDLASPEPLGTRGAHRVLAALLEALSRKHLLTEEDINEALREGEKR